MLLGHDTSSIHRTRDVQILQDINFDTMLLGTKTLQGLKKWGFYKPSPIQLHGIPLGKCGFDLLLEAKSGTGKTAVFSVIALETLNLEKGQQVLILAPTREIAAQICAVIKQIGQYLKGLCVEVVMGGLPVQDDILKFKNNNVHIVVGSPGRVRHLIEDNHIGISSIRLLVLDEADKLLEKSFQADINYIFSALPTRKQVIMCSATFPEETKTFINKYVRNVQHICPDSTSILLGISQKVVFVKSHLNIIRQTQLRFEALLNILTKIEFKQCLIFCNYQARIADLHKLLTREKWPAQQLYGQQDQVDRLDALKTLQEYKCRILISTDLAARGIDASNVDLVINFEPPFEWQTYLHRIGRAGRYGSYGLAVSILSQGKEEKAFKESIKTISDNLVVTDLWSEEKIDICESHNELKKNTENKLENLHDKREDEIINEVKEQNHTISNTNNNGNSEDIEIQGFNKLCISYEEVKSNNENKLHKKKVLETFDDKREDEIINEIKEQSHTIFNKNKNDKCEDIEIQDFNKLRISYEEVKSNNVIESFSDLLTSFKNHMESTDDFEMPNPPYYCIPLYPVKKTSSDLENTTLDSKNHDIMGIPKPMNIECEDEQLLETEISSESERNYNENVSNVDNFDITETNDTRALRMAGLPTVFGRSKHTRTIRKSYNDNKNSKNSVNTVTPFSSKEIQTKKMKLPTKTSNSYNRNIKEIDSKVFASKTHPSSYSSDCVKYKNKREDELLETKSNSSTSSEESSSEESSEESEFESDNECRSVHLNKKYINWYNKLKFVTNQIEHMVYIEELTKLYTYH